jgi:hypothetical protein
MIKEAVTIYGFWWAISRLIKWSFILGWPAMIIYGCGMAVGSDPEKWSEGAKTVVTVISLLISVPAYWLYRRGQERVD